MKTIVLICLICLPICGIGYSQDLNQFTNKIAADRMLLVLSAPSIHNRYYQPAFKLIVDFQVSYAHAIMGNDNVVVIVDRETKSHYQNRLPDDILITA